MTKTGEILFLRGFFFYFRAVISLAEASFHCYNEDMTRSDPIPEYVSTHRGKVLFAIASGENLTKLEIKERTSLSMSTVISAVDALVAEGIVSLETEKVKSGGKPHSVINVRPERCVYGVSYKSATLTAVACDLKGGTICELSQGVDGTPPQAVLSILEALSRKAPDPLGISFALNCDAREALLSRVEERFHVSPSFMTNTAAVAYLCARQGASFPLVALGVGNHIKCVSYDGKSCRVADVGDLPSAFAFSEEGSYRSLLSAARVESTLRLKSYRGHYLWEGDRLAETKDLSSYSRALVRAFVALTETVDVLLAPKEIYLFGEYVTQRFFERIREESGARNLRLFRPDESDFAYGAAISALMTQVLN